MKEAILAIYYHASSDNYNKAVNGNLESFEHRKPTRVKLPDFQFCQLKMTVPYTSS